MPIVESHSASAPPTVQRRADEVELLLAFVRDRDVHCPRCDYNLRNLTQPVCPECREELALSVGARRPSFVWLIVAMAPGIFSGIAAFIMLFVLTAALVLEGPPSTMPWQPFYLQGVGWCSVIAMVVLYVRRSWFLKKARGAQIMIAGAAWLLHVLLLLLFIWLNT